MSYSRKDIDSTIKNLDSSLKIENLKGAKATSNNRRLLSFAGGYNVVYQLTKEGEKWALRVPLDVKTPINNKRLQQIVHYLRKINLPYFTEVIYDEKSLEIDGEWVDTTRMKWIEGQLLKEYIEENLNNPTKLFTLADNLLRMYKELHKCNISHGDLQSENIIIVDNQIKLIDYDSICVPKIEGSKEFIAGKKSYQHPSRKGEDGILSAKTDYFSELIIYLSVFAIAERPSLWKDYQVEDKEGLLFTENDFSNYKQSAIYKELNSISADVALLNEILERYLENNDYLTLEPFDIYLVPEIITFNVSKSKILKGDKIKISYKVNNVRGVVLKQNKKNINVTNNNNNHIIPLSEDTIFKLIAKNYWGKEENTYLVKVFAPPIIEFGIEKESIPYDEPAIIHWKVENGLNITLSFEDTKIPLNRYKGKQKLWLTKDTICYITVLAKDGYTEFKKEAKIKVFLPNNITVFKVDTKTAIEQVPIRFSWEVENANKIYLCSSKGDKIETTYNYINIIPKQETYYWIETYNDCYENKSEEIIIGFISFPRVQPLPKIDNFTFPKIDIQFANITKNIYQEFLKEVLNNNITKPLSFLERLLCKLGGYDENIVPYISQSSFIINIGSFFIFQLLMIGGCIYSICHFLEVKEPLSFSFSLFSIVIAALSMMSFNKILHNLFRKKLFLAICIILLCPLSFYINKIFALWYLRDEIASFLLNKSTSIYKLFSLLEGLNLLLINSQEWVTKFLFITVNIFIVFSFTLPYILIYYNRNSLYYQFKRKYYEQ